ncbi:hypothetical protein BC629DRAFT_544242 [Irpex lacteus]|nr:hypothetical protein BC629DRAFT_544242 [Irpex lacteus]
MEPILLQRRAHAFASTSNFHSRVRLMFSRFPEETIHSILRLTLCVNVVDTCTDSDFRLRPPIHLLLVCKQWHRIGTPLLYETVKIADESQMQLLADTLQTNPALGPLIRHLRLDGGYGRPLHAIVKAAPNIRVLSLELQVLSKTSVTGLLRSLPQFNPTELYLHSMIRGRRDNNKSRALTTSVLEAMKRWDSLRLLSFDSCDRDPNAIRILAHALQSAPQISTIAFSQTDLDYLLHKLHFQEVVRASDVTRIRCYGISGCLETKWKVKWERWESVPEDVRRLVVYEETAEVLEMLEMFRRNEGATLVDGYLKRVSVGGRRQRCALCWYLESVDLEGSKLGC